MTQSPAGLELDLGYFARRDVAGLGADLRRGETTPNDLVEEALRAAHRTQPQINAFVTIDDDGARAAARRATRELALGIDRGPLHGIPIAVKDMLDTAGLRTTMGSRHYAEHTPTHDATCVRRLREAGAIIVGKAMTHEFAYGPTGDRSLSGPARNPLRLSHMAGGSSGGSAAAVAAGVVPLAVGTDTGGSVRIPAACCGIVGLRPTSGALPGAGVFPLSPTLDAVGPMARSVADCRLFWRALRGAEPDGGARSELRRPRIGWVSPGTFHPTDTAIADLVRGSLDNRDVELRDVRISGAENLRRFYRVIQSSEVYAVHAQRLAEAPHLFGAEVRGRLQGAAEVRGWEYVQAIDARTTARRDAERLLAEYDVLALPTLPIAPPELDARTATVAGEEVSVPEALLSLTSPWSVLGFPAISVPTGQLEGMPVGLQLVAAPGNETALLDIAQWVAG